MNSEWKTATKYVIGVFLTIFIIYLVYISRSVLLILVGAALISLLLSPLIRFFSQKLRIPKLLAVTLSHILAALLLLLIPLIFLPSILNAASVLLVIDYQEILNNSLDWVETTLIGFKQTGVKILGFSLVFDSIIDPILGYLQGVTPEFQFSLPSYDVIIDSVASAFTVSYGIAVSLLGSVVSGFIAFLFLILSSMYLSMDGSKFYNSFLLWLPESQREEIDILGQRVRHTWDSFFRGQFLLMIIIGTSVWLGLTILGLPGAFALGILAGVLEIIPSLGPVLAAIPALFVALIQGSNHFEINHFIFALIVMGFYILVQLLENYLVVPQVLGGAVKLHPLVVMAGVIVGASVWGILGALLAAPIVASMKEILDYIHHKLLGEQPFPAVENRYQPQVSLRESLRALILKGQRFAQDKLPGSASTKQSDENAPPSIPPDHLDE